MSSQSKSCRVTDLVTTRLRESSHQALQAVSHRFEEGVLRLRGHLPSFYLKQMAQAAVMNLDGVNQVINQIEVTGYANKSSKL